MSSTTSEHVKLLEGELEKVGITPTLHRTGSGHLLLRWKANGTPRALLTSWSPSDHRSGLNARARMRRMLREDGLLDAPKKEAKLAKALSLPKPHEPDNVRIARLEQDVATLLDILTELSSALVSQGIRLGEAPAAPPPVPAPMPVAVDDADRLAPPTRSNNPVNGREASTSHKGDSRWRHAFMLCIEYQLTPFKLIVQRAGCSIGCASMRLTALKRQGLIENPQRGMWRKKPVATRSNGHAVARAMHGAP